MVTKARSSLKRKKHESIECSYSSSESILQKQKQKKATSQCTPPKEEMVMHWDEAWDVPYLQMMDAVIRGEDTSMGRAFNMTFWEAFANKFSEKVNVTITADECMSRGRYFKGHYKDYKILVINPAERFFGYDDNLTKVDSNHPEVDTLLKFLVSWINGNIPMLVGNGTSVFSYRECLQIGNYMKRSDDCPTFSQLECVCIGKVMEVHASIILHPADIFDILNHLHYSLEFFCMILTSNKEVVTFDYMNGSLEPIHDKKGANKIFVEIIRTDYEVVIANLDLLRVIFKPTYDKLFESQINKNIFGRKRRRSFSLSTSGSISLGKR